MCKGMNALQNQGHEETVFFSQGSYRSASIKPKAKEYTHWGN